MVGINPVAVLARLATGAVFTDVLPCSINLARFVDGVRTEAEENFADVKGFSATIMGLIALTLQRREASPVKQAEVPQFKCMVVSIFCLDELI